MISRDWAPLVFSGRPELIRVPWRLNPVTEQIESDAEECTHDGHENADTPVQIVIKELVSLDHHEEAAADTEGEGRCDVAFTAVLATIAAHEVFGHNKFAILILLHLEHGHVVQDGVDEARRAHEVAKPSN